MCTRLRQRHTDSQPDRRGADPRDTDRRSAVSLPPVRCLRPSLSCRLLPLCVPVCLSVCLSVSAFCALPGENGLSSTAQQPTNNRREHPHRQDAAPRTNTPDTSASKRERGTGTRDTLGEIERGLWTERSEQKKRPNARANCRSPLVRPWSRRARSPLTRLNTQAKHIHSGRDTCELSGATNTRSALASSFVRTREKASSAICLHFCVQLTRSHLTSGTSLSGKLLLRHNLLLHSATHTHRDSQATTEGSERSETKRFRATEKSKNKQQEWAIRSCRNSPFRFRIARASGSRCNWTQRTRKKKARTSRRARRERERKKVVSERSPHSESRNPSVAGRENGSVPLARSSVCRRGR
jgi:hypothetical protein